MKRIETKKAHEESVLKSFIKYTASSNNVVKVIGNPDPPDAIITLNGKKTWIEITDAYFSRELAESTTSYAADDKVHKPVPKAERYCTDSDGYLGDPDEQFSDVLVSVIINKYDMQSIGKVYKDYGSGILLVGTKNPYSDAKELVGSEKEIILSAIKSKEQRFNEIYLYDMNDHAFCKLL